MSAVQLDLQDRWVLKMYGWMNKNVKWICPTAPRRPLTILGGMETNAWFDIAELSENMQDDVASLNHAALSIANLLSEEPPNVMIGIGGIGFGAAQALYLASKGCYDTNQRLQIKPRVVIGLNGWLPVWRSLQNNIASNPGGRDRPISLPILLAHCVTANYVVPYEFTHKCAHSLLMAGFQSTLRKYEGDHNWDEVKQWLKRYLRL
ncbi:Phospholipase/carboxylesterase/thioesterase [Arabidopsis suecica]|uniref:Phospholipase/carboxylesterase/thioesterase n=1 Tax=Arabidopsis suecica TaxID=45249 RepID=A0A8T2H8X0_ARASU|nr:Phospholipase/carboxylesterase/thioesterase [Arabidopsis suecica]